jgi:hypothetical protein
MPRSNNPKMKRRYLGEFKIRPAQVISRDGLAMMIGIMCRSESSAARPAH